MSFITVHQTRLYYRREGNPANPPLLLSHSLGADHGMWDPQMPELLSRFQVVLCDTRGHGASDAPEGEYSLEQLARDALAVADALSLPRFAFCGLSMGGAIGQWLAVNAPDRLTSLVLASTSSHFDGTALETRRQTVLKQGMAAIADSTMQRFFLPETLARGDAYANSVRSVLLATNPIGYAGCCAAIRDFNFTALLPRIKTPTLIIAGDRDQGTPWAGHIEILAGEIPGAKVVHLPTAHLSNVDDPRGFTKAVMEFL